MSEQIVLFGGTFDPVHNGHLIAARAVAEQCGYESVTLVPSAMAPHKGPAGASDADRLAMLKLAIAGEGLFEISEIELQRTGPSYTVDTLRELQQASGRDDRIHVVIGADMLADLPNWHKAWEVVELALFVVAARPPWHREMDSVAEVLSNRFGRKTAGGLLAGLHTTPLIDISSSDIRHRVSRGLSIRYLVPDAVEDYVAAHGLYSEGPKDIHRANRSPCGR